MIFLWPQILWLAAAVPVLIGAGRLLRRRHGEGGAPFNAPHIQAGSVSGGQVHFAGGVRTDGRFAWRFWGAVLLIIIALARPQWGAAEPDGQDGAPGEVVVALDLSRSMLAADVSPSRLERARAVAADLVAKLPDRRVGLIGFAGAAYLLAPPSEDRAILETYLPVVSPEHILQKGSNFAAMLDVALAAFGTAPQGRCLVVLTDGEAEPGAWQDRVATLKSRNIKVVTLGLGAPGGVSLRGADGRPLLTPAGEPIVTRMVPANLAALATGTGGQALEMSRVGELASLVRQASEPEARAPGGQSDSQSPLADRFALFAIAALVMLAWSAAREFAANPALARPRTAREPARRAAALALIVCVGLFSAHRSDAAKPLLTENDLQGEQEPLARMKEVVGRLLEKRRLDASDYLAVVEVSTRYGEIHRGHGHPLEEGVMRDGLAAIAAGRALDPNLTDWAKAKAKLERLLVPPPPAPMDDPSPPDPANEPMDGAGLQPIGGEDGKQADGDAPDDEQAPTAGAQGLQSIGGTEKDVFDPAEWRNAALVQPLDLLERLRREDSAAELFRMMQTPPRSGVERGGQTW